MPGATTKKKATTAAKPSMKLTKKDEDIIKKRLKKLLEQEGVKSKPKASTSKKSTAGCCGGSCSCSKSSGCSSGACYFGEKPKNKSTKSSAAAAKPKAKAATTKKSTTSSSTAAKKTAATKKKTTTSSNQEYSCANGVCTLKPKPKPKSKAASTKSSCEDGSCFFLKKNTNTTNKINQKKVTPMKKTPAVKPKVAPAKKPKIQPVSKKPTVSKSTKTAPKNKAKTTTVKKAPIRGSCSPCGDCFSNSSSEDYSDEEDEEESSYTDETDFDDSDDDDDFDCGGGGCRSTKKRSSNKCNDSFESGSWETDSGGESYDCSSGQCGWNVRKRDNFTDDDDEDKFYENTNQQQVKNNETALVPVNRNNYTEESETDDDDFVSEEEDSYYEEAFEEEESEEETDEDMSYEDSEYSPSDSSFQSDDDYQLPDSEAEDLIVRKGEAKLYPLHTDEEIDFDSDASSLQVVEIPTEKYSSDSTYQSVKTATEEKSENVGSDDSCPQLIPIENIDYIDSDDSCPQLVPIDEESEFNAPDLFYSSESDYEMVEEEKQVPKMKAHVFVGTPNNSKSEEQETSISTLFRNYEDTLEGNDVNDYISPLDKIANKSIDLNSSKYKVITPRSNKRKIDIDDSVLEPAEKKTYISEDMTVNESADHQGDNSSINESNSDSLESNYDVTTAKQNTTFTQPEVVEEEISSPTVPEIASRFYNAANSRYVLLLLKDRFYLYGTVKMKLIAGEVKVLGYSPQLGETIEIFSPKGYSALYIEASVQKRKDNFEENNLDKELSTYNKDFLSSDLKEISELFDHSTDAVVLLERNDQNKTVQMLRKYMGENLFPNMNSIGLDRPFYASEFILRCLFSLNHHQELKIDPLWDLIECTSQSKIMIIGGKSVGKSTLLRYLINRNITKFKKILLIDLDIGQPEVFIPQTVSATLIESPLIGPGYLKGLLAEKSYLFGDINVVLSPIAYIKCVRQLLNWCHQNEELRNIPWIVNTMGYCKGFGSELMSVISQILDPTDIIQIQSQNEFNNFDYMMTPDAIKSLPRNIFSAEERVDCYEPKHKLIIINASVTRKLRSNEADFSSRDNRFSMVIARIGTILTGHNEWLSDVKPVCASIEDLNIICFSEDKLDKYDLLDAANLNLVYLCRKKDNDLECYGLGIVRGVDHFQGKIYLLPAVPQHVLENVNTLAICNIPLPTSIVLNQGPKIKGSAPYTYNTTDSVVSKHITQIYHRPAHFSVGHRRFVRPN